MSCDQAGLLLNSHTAHFLLLFALSIALLFALWIISVLFAFDVCVSNLYETCVYKPLRELDRNYISLRKLCRI